MSNADEIAGMRERHNAIVTAAGDALQAALEKAAGDLVAEMKREAPELHAATSERQPGELRDSIGIAERGNDSVTIEASAPYARYVEFGTSKMAAEPFFFSSIRLLARRTNRTIAASISHAVSQAWEGKA